MVLGLLFMFVVIYLSMMFFMGGVYFLLNENVIVFEYMFSVLNSSYFSLSLVFDWMSLLFLGLVCFISSMVFCYSCSYMEGV